MRCTPIMTLFVVPNVTAQTSRTTASVIIFLYNSPLFQAYVSVNGEGEICNGQEQTQTVNSIWMNKEMVCICQVTHRIKSCEIQLLLQH